MKWFAWLPKLLDSGAGVVEVFTENSEAKGQRTHAQVMANAEIDKASVAQFAAEFHNRAGRTWWDSFWDGINRAPRPVIVGLVIYLLVLAVVDPVEFAEIATALALVPESLWEVFAVICGFFFAGRMQKHSQEGRLKKDAIAAAQQLVAQREQRNQVDAGAAVPAPVAPVPAAQPPSDAAGLQGIVNGRVTTLKPRGSDKHGSGHFGAARGNRTHAGVDYACPPDTPICTPIGGRVTKLGIAYTDDHHWRYVEIEQPLTQRRIRIFYVQPCCEVDDIVHAGDVIGHSQSLDRRYPSITEHVHLELRTPAGGIIDPAALFAA